MPATLTERTAFLSLLRRGLRAASALQRANPHAAQAAAKTRSNFLSAYRLYGAGGSPSLHPPPVLLARAESAVTTLEKLVALPPAVLALVLRKV